MFSLVKLLGFPGTIKVASFLHTKNRNEAYLLCACSDQKYPVFIKNSLIKNIGGKPLKKS